MVLPLSLVYMKQSPYSFGAEERSRVAELVGELGSILVAHEIDETAHAGCRCYQEGDD